jgi:glycosyltransferase involved in cell wall biosynthesis
MVTHNGQRFLRAQLDSIARQTELPAALIVVDDGSRDGTLAILGDFARASPIPVEVVHVDRSNIRDPRSRIAANVTTGLAAAAGYGVIVLADQDDEWLEDRVAGQRSLLLSTPEALLVGGNGVLVDHRGEPTGSTLGEMFPVPHGWSGLEPATRMRTALRRPLVTGAASAIRQELRPLMVPIPPGWLHDRWATLIATARGGLVLQPEPVIRYRIHAGQAVGARDANVGSGTRRWRQVLSRGTSPVGAAVRAWHVVGRVRPLAVDPTIRAELSWRAILSSGLDRT